MTTAGVVTSVRVTHDTGDVDALAAATPESQAEAAAALCDRPNVAEAFVLSTCNRVEAYVVTPDEADGRDALSEFFSDDVAAAAVESDHEASLRHLLRVACGLDSVVLGEDQILGQVREAYVDARSAGAIGSTLETAVTKAIHVGERARTETAINEGVVSLGSAATRLAARTVDVEDETALVVGAGEMATLAARSLTDNGVADLLVANRTVSHAERVLSAVEADGRAVSLDELGTVADEAAVVVAATGSTDPVVGPAHLGGRDQVVVDLGQPRDVDPAAGSVAGVTVYDLDDLEAVTAETRDRRSDAASAVEEMIDREFDQLLEQYKRTRADAVIAAMYESAEQVKARELDTAFSRLAGEEFTDDQREVVESLADALVGQLLAPPTRSLREAAAQDDWSTINTALQLFDPEFGPDSGSMQIPGPAVSGEMPIAADRPDVADADGESAEGDHLLGVADDD